MPDKNGQKRTKTDFMLFQNGFECRKKPDQNGLRCQIKTDQNGRKRTKTDKNGRKLNLNFSSQTPYQSVFVRFIRFCPFLSVFVRFRQCTEKNRTKTDKNGLKRTKTDQNGIFALMLSRKLLENKMAANSQGSLYSR